jgi:flagellar motility protein MotE (MotC chaperone)
MRARGILLIAILINLSFVMVYMNQTGQVEAAQQAAGEEIQEQQTPQERWKEIREREEALKLREQQMKELEKTIDEKIARLNSIESLIQKEVDAYKQESNDRIGHLVKIYSSMKPKAAASLMDKMDLKVAVEVFLNMKGDIAGGVLSYMDTKKAATITEHLMKDKRSK